MKERDLSWMKWMCDPLRAEKARIGVRRDDEGFQIMAKPWTVIDRSGCAWSVATNGNSMVVVQGFGGFVEAPDHIRSRFTPYIGVEVHGHKFSFGEFKQWCGTVWKRPLPCPDCDGVWARVCPKCLGQGRHSSKCQHCGDEHKCPCSGCADGGGVVYCESCVGVGLLQVDHCLIGGAVFNRALIAQCISGVGAELVKITVQGAGQSRGLHVAEEHGDWSIVVMPLASELDPEDYPCWDLTDARLI